MRIQRIFSGLVSLTLVLVLTWILFETPTDAFKGLPPGVGISTLNEAASNTAGYLWDKRLLDLISQALVVFSAVICVLALFRGEESD